MVEYLRRSVYKRPIGQNLLDLREHAHRRLFDPATRIFIANGTQKVVKLLAEHAVRRVRSQPQPKGCLLRALSKIRHMRYVSLKLFTPRASK
jgi:hypothetical protein